MAIDLFKLQGLVTVTGVEIAEKKLRGVEKAAYNLMKPLTALGRRAERTGAMLTKRLSVPLGILGGAAIKFAGDFEKAMTTSTAIMTGVNDDLRKQLEETAKQLSTKSTFSATELAESYYYLASAGLSVEQSIASLDKVTRFATAGQFDLKTATDLLTDAQSALGMESENTAMHEENMVRISDVLVKANTLANASVEQFAQSLTNKAAASLRILGKDVEEGVAVLSAFANQGVKGEEAGTQLAIVLRDLQKAAINNKKEFKKTGIAVFDASEDMRNLSDIIGDVEKALEGKSDADKKAMLSTLGFQERSVQSLLTLIGTSEAIREFEKNLNDAAGTTEDVANKQLNNFNDQMKIMFNRLKLVAIELGEELLPIIKNRLFPLIKGLIDSLRTMVKWFKNLSPETKKWTIAFIGLTGAIGPLLFGLSKFIFMITSLPGLLTSVKIAYQGLKMALMKDPIYAAATAITVLAGAIITAAIAYENSTEVIKKHREEVQKDIEARQLSLKQNLLQELIASYVKLNELSTIPNSGEEYYKVKKAVDNLETSLSDLGLTFEGGYIKRLQDARIAYADLQKVEMEEINVLANLEELTEEERQAIEKRIKTLEDEIEALEKEGKEVDELIKLWDKLGKQADARKAKEDAEARKYRQQQEKNRLKEFEERESIDQQYRKLTADTLSERIALIEDERKKEIAAAEKVGAETYRIDQYYSQLRSQLVKDETFRRLDGLMSWVNTFTGMAQQLYDNESIAIDNNYKRRQKSIQNSEKSEEEKNKALATLDDEYDKKRTALQKKQMFATKTQALFEIGINTIKGAVEAFPNLILSGIITAIGLAQAALVASKPIPELAEGGIIPKSREGRLVRAAEAGQDEGFIPMKTGTASIADAIINNMRRYPFTSQQENNVGRFSTGSTVALNIGTLVADDRGLTELERRLRVFRIADNNRLGIA